MAFSWWFTPQIATVARAGPDRMQGSGCFHGSFILVAGAQILGSPVAASLDTLIKCWIGRGATGSATKAQIRTRAGAHVDA